MHKSLKKFISLIVILLLLNSTVVYGDDQSDVASKVNPMRGSTDYGTFGEIFTTLFNSTGHIKDGFINVFQNSTQGHVPFFDGGELKDSTIFQDGSGNVGIGTTTPSQKLDINGSIINRYREYFYRDNISKIFSIGNYQNKLNFYVEDDENGTNVQRVMVIDNTGNIGIGTTSPGRKLHVKGTGDISRFEGTSGFIDIDGAGTRLTGSNGLGFRGTPSGNNQAFLTTSGNLGIGTDSASEKLQVIGGISISQDPNSGDDVGDRDYNDARYINVGESISENDPQVGTNITNYLSKWNGSSLVSSDLFNNSGRIGIGTTNPGAKFEIWQTGTSNSDGFRIDGSGLDSWRFYLDENKVANIERASQKGNGISITHDGKVGIGTASPVNKLHIKVNGVENSEIAEFTNLNDGRGLVIGLNANGSVNDAYVTYDAQLTTYGGHIFKNGGNEVFRIGSNGNVGIGTTNPGSIFHVNGGTNGWGIFERGGKRLYINANWSNQGNYAQLAPRGSDNMGLSLSSSDSNPDRLFITNSGNIGIGTLSPTQKLDVNGNAVIRGNLDLTGGTLSGDDITDGTIDSTELAPQSVYSSEIADNTITEADISDSFKARDSDKLDGHDTGYFAINSTHDKLFITDTRGSQRLPSYYNDRYVQWDFQNSSDTLAGGDTWHAINTISKWSSFHPSHKQEQIVYTGDRIKHRIATSNDTWGSWKGLAYTSDKLSDSDKLDNIDSTQFLRSDTDDVMNGNLDITGDLKMIGSDSYIWLNGLGNGYTGIRDTFNDKTLLFASSINGGKVGIGTTTPIAKLTVKGTGLPDSKWTWTDIKDNLALELGSNGDGDLGSIKMNSYDTNQFVLQRPSNGNYHIDSTTGKYYFNRDESVRGSSNGMLLIADESGNEDIILNTSGNSWFNGGNVGIGTSSPSQKLDVNGSVIVRGGLDLTGGTLSGDDITDGTIDGGEIENNSIGSIDIIDNDITEADITDSFKARDSDKLDGVNSDGFLRKYTFNVGSSGGSLRYMKLFTLSDTDDGISGILSSEGDYGNYNRGRADIMIGTRGGNISANIYTLNFENISDATMFYYKKVGSTYEIWARFADYNYTNQHTFALLSTYGGTNFTFDSITTSAPSGLNLINTKTYWHSSNDSSGSGLDADKLDNIDSTQFLRDVGTIPGTGKDTFTGLKLASVSESGYSNNLVNFGGAGGSTPSFQLLANYDDHLYFRASRDSETNWDGRPFYKVFTERDRQTGISTSEIEDNTITASDLAPNSVGDSEMIDDPKFKSLRFTGEGGNSGNGVLNYSIYQEGGNWTSPFPDLVIGYHTGIKIGGHKNYGGTRFYNDAPGRAGTSTVMEVANGDDGVKINNSLGIGVEPRTDGYKLAMGGPVYMGNQDVNYVNQLHFNDNIRFYDEGNDNYLNFKYGDPGSGGIKFIDGNSSTQGTLYASGNENDFGLLDADGQWAIRIDKDDYVELRDNNEVTFRAGQGGVSGNYGTVQTHGNGKGGREGYSINGRTVFMNDGVDVSGIYNDVDNEWMTHGTRNGSYRLYYNGAEKIRTENSGITITGDTYANAYYYNSDKNYKDDISKLNNSLEKINKISGFSYLWKDSGKSDIGVIAQDVEKTFPELVTTNAEGYKSVKYGNLVAPIIESIKELYEDGLNQKEIIKLNEDRINLQDKQIKKLEKKLRELEGKIK